MFDASFEYCHGGGGGGRVTDMFSPGTLKYVAHVSQFGSRMGFIPYKCKVVNHSHATVEEVSGGHPVILLERRTGLAWFLWRIFVICGIFFCFFKTIILVYYIQTTMASGQKKTLELFMVVALTYGMAFHINTVLFPDEIEAMFNYIITLNRRLRDDLKSEPLRDGLELYVKFYSGVTVVFLLSFYPFMYNRKSEIQNLYTYIGGTNEFYRLTYQVVEFFIASGYFTIATFYNFLIVGGANTMLYWLVVLNRIQDVDESRLRSMNLPLSVPALFRMWKIINYRQIGFVNVLYYKSIAIYLIVAGLAYCCVIFILSSYVVMKYYEALGIQGTGSLMIVACMALLMVIVAMQFSVNTTLNSRKVLASLNKDLSTQDRKDANTGGAIMSPQDITVLRRVLQSLRPIIAHIGIFFPVERSTLLTVMDFNFSSLIDLILTFELSKF